MKMLSDLTFALSFGLTKLRCEKQTEILFTAKLVFRFIRKFVIFEIGFGPVTFRTMDP